MYTMADAAAIWQSIGAANPFFLIQGTGVVLRRNFGGGLAGTLLIQFSGIVSMDVVFNFTGVMEIEFAGAVELGINILYHVNNLKENPFVILSLGSSW
ncbi:unnamed protein product, partial [Brassica oleracea var. botrytis]|uniref:Uncharacterized protein n=2 Tax=Brassica TaxID=3705 RepID=A0A3P6E8F5_BRAOL|nr:unnamed protein product [Brassica napus]VDD27779.1 unnamed protein product [Brassica oleracea]